MRSIGRRCTNGARSPLQRKTASRDPFNDGRRAPMSVTTAAPLCRVVCSGGQRRQLTQRHPPSCDRSGRRGRLHRLHRLHVVPTPSTSLLCEGSRATSASPSLPPSLCCSFVAHPSLSSDSSNCVLLSHTPLQHCSSGHVDAVTAQLHSGIALSSIEPSFILAPSPPPPPSAAFPPLLPLPWHRRLQSARVRERGTSSPSHPLPHPRQPHLPVPPLLPLLPHLPLSPSVTSDCWSCA